MLNQWNYSAFVCRQSFPPFFLPKKSYPISFFWCNSFVFVGGGGALQVLKKKQKKTNMDKNLYVITAIIQKYFQACIILPFNYISITCCRVTPTHFSAELNWGYNIARCVWTAEMKAAILCSIFTGNILFLFDQVRGKVTGFNIDWRLGNQMIGISHSEHIYWSSTVYNLVRDHIAQLSLNMYIVDIFFSFHF